MGEAINKIVWLIGMIVIFGVAASFLYDGYCTIKMLNKWKKSVDLHIKETDRQLKLNRHDIKILFEERRDAKSPGDDSQ